MTAEEQPEGIVDDSAALPTLAGAARRVNDFLGWYGDGLIYVETGAPPLFARDLQALTNHVTGEGTRPHGSETEWGHRTPWGAHVRQPSEEAARKLVEHALPGARTLVRREVGPWIEVQP